MSNTTKILGDEAGVQVSDIFIKESDLDEVKYQGLIVGSFRRGRTDKPMLITPQNISSVLGHDPLNKDYQLILDAFEQGIPSVLVYRLVGGGFIIEPTELEFIELSLIHAKSILGANVVNNALLENGFYGALNIYINQKQDESNNADLYIKINNNYNYIDNVNYNNLIKYYIENKLDKNSVFVVINDEQNKINIGCLLLINKEICYVYNIIGNNYYIKRGLDCTVPANHDVGDSIVILNQGSYLIDGLNMNEDYFFKSTPIVGNENLELVNAIEYKHKLGDQSKKPFPPKNIKINNKYHPDILKDSLFISWVNQSRFEILGVYDGWYSGSDNSEDGVYYIVELINSNNEVKKTFTFEGSDSLGVYLDYSDIDTPVFLLKMYSILNGVESEQSYENLLIIDFDAPKNLTAILNNTTLSVDLKWEFGS